MRDKFLESNEGLLTELKIPNGGYGEATTILPERLEAELWKQDYDALLEYIKQLPDKDGREGGGKERLKDMLLKEIREDGKQGVKNGDSARRAIITISFSSIFIRKLFDILNKCIIICSPYLCL